jgi:signal transduction histidine kinase
MKNTKNVLITSVVLAITLFASVQITAMEPERRINPYLSEVQKQVLKNSISDYKNKIQRYGDPKNPLFNPGAVNIYKYKLQQEEAKLYGSNPLY